MGFSMIDSFSGQETPLAQLILDIVGARSNKKRTACAMRLAQFPT